MIQEYASKLGVPTKLLAVAIALWGLYPTSLVFNLIPKKYHAVKHMFSIISSAMFYCFLFNPAGYFEMVVVATIIYLFTKAFRNRYWNPLFTFVFSMTHLSWNHLYATYFRSDADRYDNTAPMMVMVIKLTSFAWSAYDGTLNTNNPDVEKRRIVKYPSYLAFMGYISFFCTFLVGPACEYTDYETFIASEPPFHDVPSPVIPTLKSVFSAVLSLIFYMKYGATLGYEQTLTEDFQQFSFLKKFVIFNIAGFTNRTKYYTAWKLAEGACNIIGFGYEGKDSRSKIESWNRGRNADIMSIEFPENPRMMVGAWNMNTARWLRNHVYLRFIRDDGKNAGLVTVITFVTSALWHGFKAGFHISFIFMALYTMTGRILRRHLRPLFMGSSNWASLKPIYDVLGMLMSYAGTNYILAPFMLLDLKSSFKCWASMYYYQHIFMLFIIIGFRFLGWGRYVHRIGVSLGAYEPYKEDDHDKKNSPSLVKKEI